MPHDLTPSADTGGAAETARYLRSTPIPDEDAVRRLTESPHLQTTGWEAMMMRHIASLRARLAESEGIITSYRGMLAAKLGYTLIPEDTVVRPDAMSYVKPSEFDRMAAALTREPTP